MMDVDRLACGDSAELLKTLPEGSVDLTVTSPPYDNLRMYSGYVFDFETIARELYRVTKPGGVVAWVVADATINGSETGTSFRQALHFMQCGFNLHDTMIWKKDSCAFPESARYYQNFEYMFILSKGAPKTFNPIADRKNTFAGHRIHGTFRNRDGSTTQRNATWKQSICNEFGVRFNVWEIPSEKANKTGHPAVFPLRLAMDLITSWSNEKEIVLDPFLGSGTTAIAAHKLHRHYIGFEISEKYFESAAARVQSEKDQLTIFDYMEACAKNDG